MSFAEPNPFAKPEFQGGKDKVFLATICLHISAVIYVLLGLFLFALLHADNMVLALLMTGFVAGIGIFVEIVVAGLRQRRMWAWMAGLCLCGLYIPSLFFPLGALGLWGLLDRGSREAFGIVRPEPAEFDP